jgi:hypothetical protein
MTRSFGISSLAFVLFALAVLSNPWNTPLVGGFRANDLLLLATLVVVLSALQVSRRLMAGFLIFLVIMMASIAVSLGFRPTMSVERVAFLYKYALLFFIPVAAFALLTTPSRARRLEACLLYGFLFLVVWVYAYNFLVSIGTIRGVDRASFPGSTDLLVSDAHLYSNYLGVSLLFYMLHLRERRGHNVLVASVIILLAAGALVLTGSRNGLLTLVLGLALWVVVGLFLGTIVIGRTVAIMLGLFGLVGLAAAIYFRELLLVVFSVAASRAFNFDLSGDESSQNRLLKLGVAIEDWLGSSFMLGAGIFGASFLWYDTGVGIVLAHLGFLGASFFIVFLVLVYKRLVPALRSRMCRVSFVILSVYVFSNLITEFALVTRSLLPVMLYICVPLAIDAIERRERDRAAGGKPAD